MSAPPAPAGVLGDAVLTATGAGDCLVVGAPSDDAVAAVRARAPDRFVPVAGAQVRAAVAAGAALAGRRVVLLLAGGDVPARLPVADLPAGGGIVAVTAEVRVAGACWGAGWTLAQPAGPVDVPPLLAGALESGVPTVLRLPAPPSPGAAGALGGAGAPGAAGPVPGAPRLGLPRVLHEGTAGLVAASGPVAVALLDTAARLLAERGVAVQALELHTAAPGEGPGPAASDRVLLVGDAAVDPATCERGRWPRGLRVVPVAGGARAAMEAVAAHLRARR